jgi:signal peptide peptidase SppA
MDVPQESIVRSAWRSFCRMFFAVVGIFIGLFLMAFVYSMIGNSPMGEEKTTLEILPNASNQRDLLSFHSPAILQIDIHGVIGDPKGINSDSIQQILLDSQTGILQGGRIKGILLHMNTPGGAVFDADNIYQMLNEYKAQYKVPIFTYVDGLCASGGMYIASATDRIFASPSSIIGSVGVISGPFFNLYDAITKLGIQAKTLTEGLGKDAMNPMRPWKEGEDQTLQHIIAFFYQRFVSIVTKARPNLSKEKLIHEYGAKVFDCIKAKEYGYIDEAPSSRNEALLALLQEAKLDPKEPYQVIALKPKHDLFSEVFQSKFSLLTGKIEHKVDLGQPPINGPCAYLYTYE